MKKVNLKLAVSLIIIALTASACGQESPEKESPVVENGQVQGQITSPEHPEAPSIKTVAPKLAPLPSSKPKVTATEAGQGAPTIVLQPAPARVPTIVKTGATASSPGNSQGANLISSADARRRLVLANPIDLGKIDEFRLEEMHQQYVEFIYGNRLPEAEKNAKLQEIAQNYAGNINPDTHEFDPRALFEFALTSDAQLKDLFHQAQSQIIATRGALRDGFSHSSRSRVNEGINELSDLTSICTNMKIRITETAKIYGLFGKVYQEPDYFSFHAPLFGAVVNLQILQNLPDSLSGEYRDILFDSFQELLKATAYQFTFQGDTTYVSFYDFSNSQMGFFNPNKVGFF